MELDDGWVSVGAALAVVVGAILVFETLSDWAGTEDPLVVAFYAAKYGLLAVGLAQAYAGYWIHVKRLQMRGAVVGFAATVGAALFLWGPARVVDQWVPVLVVALVGAGVGAELVVAFHRLFVAASGFVVGVGLGAVFLTPGLQFTDPVVVAAGLVTAVVAGVLHVVFVVANTALTGGGLVVLSLLMGRTAPSFVDVVASGGIPRGTLLAGAFVAVTGMVVQLGTRYGGVAPEEGPGERADATGGEPSDEGPSDDGPPDSEFDDDRDYRGIR